MELLPLVVAIVPGVRVGPRVVSVVVSAVSVVGSTSLSLGDCCEVSGLGVLDLGRLDWHSVVDDGNVIGARMVVGWSIVSWCIMIGGSMMSTALGFSNSREMGGLGVLHLGCVDWDSIVDDWDSVVSGMMGWCVVGWGCNVTVVGGGVSGKVLGLGVLDFGGIDWDSIVDVDGRSGMGPWGSVGVTSPEGSLVQMVESTSLGVSMGVSDLGGGYFGCVMRHSMSSDSMRPRNGIGQRAGHMGIGHGRCDMMGVRDVIVVSDWGDNGVVDWSWSNGQVGSGYLESVHGIGSVLHGLNMTVSVDIRVSTMRNSVSRSAFVLLGVRVGVSIRVGAMVILTNVLTGHGRTIWQGCSRCHQQKSYHLMIDTR